MTRDLEHLAESAMDMVYCCMSCHWRGRFGELIGADTMRCPTCASDNLELANSDIQSTEWHGEKPKVLQ
jgi:DNA-directed RNA polymerase subunit RPC12/RpoP